MSPSPSFDEARLPSAPDTEVVLHALGGHEAAAREVVRRYQRPVYNLVRRMVRDASTAEDLAQETFLKIFRSLGTFDPRLRLSAWVLKIAHNTAVDHLRRSRIPYVPLESDDDEESPPRQFADERALPPDRAASQGEMAEAHERALGGLRPEYRAALTLRYQEDLDYEEIADVLSLPLGTVKTFRHRGRHALAERLGAEGWGPAVPVKPAPGTPRRAG
jgi:RNA polymerase sigma-70 factor (ECF subfamily)